MLAALPLTLGSAAAAKFLRRAFVRTTTTSVFANSRTVIYISSYFFCARRRPAPAPTRTLCARAPDTQQVKERPSMGFVCLGRRRRNSAARRGSWHQFRPVGGGSVSLHSSKSSRRRQQRNWSINFHFFLSPSNSLSLEAAVLS